MVGRLNRIGWAGFDMAFGPWMRHHLQVLVGGAPSAPLAPGPVLLVSNHVSWWDGFLLRKVQRSMRRHGPLYTIALQRELAAHPVLRVIGGVGMDPASPSSILHAMRGIERRCADDRDSVIGYFPQGCIAPSFRRPLGFTRGVELFARRIGALTVVPVALHIEPLNGMAPTAFVRIGAPQFAAAGEVSVAELESDVTTLLDATLASIALYGEDAARDWMRDIEESSAPRWNGAALDTKPALPHAHA